MSEAMNTPMLRQYASIKEGYPDAILFFRLGDFYEMFLDDAKVAAKELQLTLTGRGKDENRVPMCGIPYHAADQYVAKLTHRGFKVAICEQVEDPATAKGITRREVVKVITPGTTLQPECLDHTASHFLASVICHTNGKTGLAYADVS
ncbi:MAG: DNA mismatch repair protein MutS, partial [Candidatus Margulisiibacteriota bacterium]